MELNGNHRSQKWLTLSGQPASVPAQCVNGVHPKYSAGWLGFRGLKTRGVARSLTLNCLSRKEKTKRKSVTAQGKTFTPVVVVGSGLASIPPSVV